MCNSVMIVAISLITRPTTLYNASFVERLQRVCIPIVSNLIISPHFFLRVNKSTIALDEALVHVQISVSENFPSRLRNKMKSHTQEITRDTIGSGPRIDIDCPKCPSKEASYSQVQMRSADEGSTIFYTCLHCGHRYVFNIVACKAQLTDYFLEQVVR